MSDKKNVWRLRLPGITQDPVRELADHYGCSPSQTVTSIILEAKAKLDEEKRNGS